MSGPKRFLTSCAAALLACAGCASKPLSEFTSLPYASAADVRWIRGFGRIPSDPSGSSFFEHSGIDFGAANGANFLAVADGEVTLVELDTGMGYPGTNTRIEIEVASGVVVGYHFEIAGTISLEEMRRNVYVAEGDLVKAGQPIGALANLGDAAHVDLGVSEGGSRTARCTLRYFAAAEQEAQEALYDRKPRTASTALKSDLCD